MKKTIKLLQKIGLGKSKPAEDEASLFDKLSQKDNETRVVD